MNCKNCGKKIEKSFVYCPYCGFRQKEPDGLLDEIEEMERQPSLHSLPSFPSSFPFFGNFNKIFRNLIANIEREMEKVDKEIKPIKSTKLPVARGARGISIKIQMNGGEPKIAITRFGEEKKEEKESEVKKEIKGETGIKREIGMQKDISEKLEKLEKFPREEAKTKIKRLSDVIIYEISLPGVKDIRDVVIKKLENSIEIKAIAKDKIYFKLIPVALSIMKYELKKEKLFIYFNPEI